MAKDGDDDVIRLPTGRGAGEEAGEVTYDIGGYPPDVPLVGSWKVKGTLKLRRQLPLGSNVTVQICGPDGEVVASGEGHVDQIPFVEHDDKDLFWVERRHVASI